MLLFLHVEQRRAGDIVFARDMLPIGVYATTREQPRFTVGTYGF